MLLRAQTVKTLRCRGTFQGAGAQATFRYSPDGTKTFQLGKKNYTYLLNCNRDRDNDRDRDMRFDKDRERDRELPTSF
jgi:hypothetical protein